MNANNENSDDGEEVEENLEAIEDALPKDFRLESDLTIRRDRSSTRGYPLYLQIVEADKGIDNSFLSPYYIVKGS